MAPVSANAQIEDSTTIPHAEISGVGDDTYDYYFFSVAVDNTDAIFDIDCGNQTLGLPNTGCDDRNDAFDRKMARFGIIAILALVAISLLLLSSGEGITLD